MSRPARFSSEQIVAATAEVAAERGPGGASVARIASKLNAPTGSIYHRFASRSVLLGEVWLQAASSFQSIFFQKLFHGPDPVAAGLAAVEHLPQRVRAHPQEARILLLHRREDFLEKGWPESMAAQAKGLQNQMLEGLRNFCERLLGRTDSESMRVITFALIEGPLAGVKRHVEAGESPPAIVDLLIAETYHASLALVGVTR